MERTERSAGCEKLGQREEEGAISKVIVDTDVLIWHFRGNAVADKFLQHIPYEKRSTSSLCIMELIQGCLNRQELKAVKDFVKDNISSIIHPDDKIVEKAILLLERHALSDGVRTIDALLAASAIITRAALATSNLKHYKKIHGLRLLPFEP